MLNKNIIKRIIQSKCACFLKNRRLDRRETISSAFYFAIALRQKSPEFRAFLLIYVFPGTAASINPATLAQRVYRALHPLCSNYPYLGYPAVRYPAVPPAARQAQAAHG